MHEIKCPNCGYANSIAENFCLNCGCSLVNRSAAFTPFAPQNVVSNSALGSRVFLFYSLYNVLIGLCFLGSAAIGALAIIGSYDLKLTAKEANEAFLGGVLFIIMGLPSILFLLSPVLPKKPWHWSFGIVLISLSLLLCVTFPAAVPLLFYWVKPETKAYFGRR